MAMLDAFRWRGSEQVYGLPWLKNRIEYTADPRRVQAYSRTSFTRSKLTMDLLTRFHLSNNSIVVSEDEHAAFLRRLFLQHLPARSQFPEIAKNLVDTLAQPTAPVGTTTTIHLSEFLIREVYRSLLENILGIYPFRPLTRYIDTTRFKPGMRPLHVEGIMYALGLLLPDINPIKSGLEWMIFRERSHARRTAKKLESLIVDFSAPKPGGWYETLLALRSNGRITPSQFRGELTSIFVSAYSVASAMASMLLCLAVRTEYMAKIRTDHRLATCFVNEVLRLYPPFRQFGYEQKGVWARSSRPHGETTDFMITVFSLHRNADAWPNPTRFEPERFLAGGAKGGHKFLPFGMGRRACPGRIYSMRLLVEALKYVCSEPCGVGLAVPTDFTADESGLPVGVSGRLISFPVDDRLTLQLASASENKDS